jgi:chitinase
MHRLWVTLTSPTNGASFTANSTIPLAATASDPDGSVAQVAFYADGHLVGKPVKQSPYTMNLTGLKAGFHTIQAVATDQYGMTGRSATVHISVSQ